MGRAIVRNPEVFLFDEPLSNLDAQLRVAMRTEIRALHQRLGTTTVYVTHDQIEAMTMADRIVVMRDGNVEQIGTPLEIYDGPVNTFVATFIGSPSMNLLRGRIGGSGDDRVFDLDGGGSWPLPPGLAGAPGREAIYGIRPEALRLDPEGAPASVMVVEPTGAETHVVLEFAGRTLTMVVHDRLMVRPGEVVRIAPDPNKAHVFDAATATRIGASPA
jgi:multiple sugar transport system ATP-binding protein